MKQVLSLTRKELNSYFSSPMALIFVGVFLAATLFTFFWVDEFFARGIADLRPMFRWMPTLMIFLAAALTMRQWSEEQQSGTLEILFTMPMKLAQLVLGKFLSGVAVLVNMTLLTAYMPALIFLHGKVSLGHVAAGYMGLMLIGSAAIALGLLCSALAPNQLVAAILGSATVATFVLLWLLSRIASPPIENLVAYLSLHDKHFRPFIRGLVSIQDVVFYVSLTYVALLGATRVMEARRWH